MNFGQPCFHGDQAQNVESQSGDGNENSRAGGHESVRGRSDQQHVHHRVEYRSGVGGQSRHETWQIGGQQGRGQAEEDSSEEDAQEVREDAADAAEDARDARRDAAQRHSEGRAQRLQIRQNAGPTQHVEINVTYDSSRRQHRPTTQRTSQSARPTRRTGQSNRPANRTRPASSDPPAPRSRGLRQRMRDFREFNWNPFSATKRNSNELAKVVVERRKRNPY